MKKIKIAHLYYDLLNLYGENGNIAALKKFLERQNVEAEVHSLTIGDKIDFQKYDFYYMGAGSEENQRIVLEDLIQYADNIKEAIDTDKMFLVTGNSMELFGEKIKLLNDDTIKCLGIFPYHSVEQETRLVSEVFYKYENLKEGKGRDILGFKNCQCNIVHNDERIFGFSNNINRNNFYGMNFVGPFLIRNPYFTNMILEKLLTSKNIEYKEITDTIEFKAYHKFLENFILNRDTEE